MGKVWLEKKLTDIRIIYQLMNSINNFLCFIDLFYKIELVLND